MFSDVPWCLATSSAFEGSIFQVSESKISAVCQELLWCSMQDQTHLPKTLTLAVTNLVLSFRFLEGKALRDDDVLQNLPVGTSVILYFRDLGPQLGWTMVSDLQNVTLDSIKHTIFKNITALQVFLAEYMGPLLIYLLFYVRVPYIYNHKYTFTSSSHHVVKYVLQKNDLLCSKEETKSYGFHMTWEWVHNSFVLFSLACACHSFHYIKRLFETIFVHRFSNGTMPLKAIIKVSVWSHWSGLLLSNEN